MFWNWLCCALLWPYKSKFVDITGRKVFRIIADIRAFLIGADSEDGKWYTRNLCLTGSKNVKILGLIGWEVLRNHLLQM